MISPTVVQQYCIKNKLFTLGSNEQYNRMFELVLDGFPLHDIATIIWICSETDKHADEIEKELEKRSTQNENNGSNVTTS